MTSKTGEDPGSGPQALPLDDVDRAIVAVLREDGRISMRALAARLHISRSGAYLRVQRLEEAGVITGYSAWVDPQRSGYVHLKIAQPAWKPLRARLMTIPEVEHAALVSGDADIVLLVRARDITALRELVLNSFQSMPEVRSTQTVLIFDELEHGPAAARPTGAAGHSPETRHSQR